MESVWLLLGGGRDAVRRPGLGFLGTSLFRCENPRFWGLEKLGFPWILSSESRLFNSLRGNLREIIFVAVPRRLGWRFAVGRLKIVDETVDLGEEALPLLGAVIVFRYDRVLVLVEPVDHLDEGATA